MKNNNKTHRIVVFAFTMLFFSCVSDQDFTIPEVLGTEENRKVEELQEALSSGGVQEITITNLKTLFVPEKAIQITSPIVVRGFVSSSDQSGNFYRELFIQDKPDNPTDAIKIVLDMNDYYNKFNFGREVYLLLNGLFIGETRPGDGVIAIGGISSEEGTAIENMTINQVENQLLRSSQTHTIVPLQLSPLSFTAEFVGRYVQIDGAHFEDEVVGKTFVDPNDTFDTQRTILSCEGFSFSPIVLETSTFADFSFSVIPSEGGSIAGVVNKTFTGDQTVLVLNTLSDIQMNQERCQPNSKEGFNLIFDEDFENTSGAIQIHGWTNYNEEGSEVWESYLDSNSESQAARIGSYRSGDLKNTAWLITPKIDLGNVTQAYLSFETSNSFADQSRLEVFLTSDWNENTDFISNATWLPLPGKVVDNAEDFRKWIYSGDINLSDYLTSVHIAFRFSGTGETDSDGTYELDNIFIYAK